MDVTQSKQKPQDVQAQFEVSRGKSDVPGGSSFTCIEQHYCDKSNQEELVARIGGSGSSPCPSSSSPNINLDNLNNLEKEEVVKVEDLVVVSCKCRSQWCEDCRVGHAVKWREKLRPYVKDWPRASMVTLTVAPKRMKRMIGTDDPEECYKFLSKKRVISVLVRQMVRDGVLEDGRFFYAIEFHQRTGQVHWHVAVIPKEKWYRRMNDPKKFGGKMYLATKWKYGYAHEKAPKNRQKMTPEYAMNYLTKYISKQDVEAPDWVLDWPGNFRKFSTSRALCGPSKSRSEPKGLERIRKTRRQTLENCKKHSRVILQTIEFVTLRGETKKYLTRRYVGNVAMPAHLVEKDERFQRAKRMLTARGPYWSAINKMSVEESREPMHPSVVPGSRWVQKVDIIREENDYAFKAEEWRFQDREDVEHVLPGD